MSKITLDFENYIEFYEFIRKTHEFLSTIEGTEQVTLNEIKEKIMALTASEQQLVSDFNDATNKIAAKIQALIDKPPTTTDNPEFVAQLGVIRDGLVALGSDGGVAPISG